MSDIQLILVGNEINLLHAILTDHVTRLDKVMLMDELSQTERLWYESQINLCAGMLSKLDSEIAEFNKNAADLIVS